jgi:hypothetical protein
LSASLSALYRVLGSSNRQNHNNHEALQDAVNSAAQEDDAADSSTSTLSRNPRCLHTLWMEYKFGLGVRKAATMFTPAERGRCKFTYHDRLIFWKKVSEMARAEWTSTHTIETITSHYGSNLSATQGLMQMIII